VDQAQAERERLEAELETAEGDLEELEAEREATLGSGHHVWSERAAYLRERFEAEASELREKIRRLREALK